MMKKTALVMAVCLGLTISFPGAVRAANGSTIEVVSMDELEKDYPELGNSGKPDLNGRQTINSGKVKKADKSAEKNNKKKKEIKDRKKKDNSQKIRNVDKVNNLGPDISVGLINGKVLVPITGLVDFKAVDLSGNELETYDAGTILTVTRDGSNIYINENDYSGPIILKAQDDKDSGAAFIVKGNKYRGSIKLLPSPQNAGVTVINVLPMEEYLYGVVPSESVPTWKPNALRAQAVAARTYALKHKNGFKSRGFDVTDTTESQVYNGYSAETKATNDAVDSTAGEIITYNGQPIDAVFSASAGGYTENSENVWGQVIPYLRGVKEEDTPEVKQAWTSKVSLDTLQKNLGIGNLQEIRLSRLTSGPMFTGDRGVSGRVKRIIFVGSNGQKTITGDNFRRLFGLKSTMFDFDIEGNTLMIYGYGWGHGLGMSQWGAEAMAEKHDKDDDDYYKDILSHYYTDTEITKIY